MNILEQALLQEEKRQRENIELIASENYASEQVLRFQGSLFTNKYAEGYPGKRYYHGCENIDIIENTARDEAKKLFSTDYHVNVQPHSGSSANMAVYFHLAQVYKGEKLRVLWMNLDGGWHLTHWAFPSFSGEKFSFFESVGYGVNDEGYLDYQAIRELAREHKPHLIIAGASAYSRIIDFQEFRSIADEVGAHLLVDMAHIAGLVATGFHPSPFGIADFVTSTTHKTLAGPRSGIIFTKNEKEWKKIDSVVFPGLQGGPLEHIIAAKAQCFIEAQTPYFKEYIGKVVQYAKIFEEEFRWYIDIVTWGTDNHLLLLDFRPLGLTGAQVADALEEVNITVNKNSVPGDTNPVHPSGIRIWSPAITRREIDDDGIRTIAENIKRVVEILRDKDTDSHIKEALIETIRQENISLVKNLPIFPNIY